MKYLNIVLSISLLLLTSQNSIASTADPGNISLVHAMSSGAVIFYHNGLRKGVTPTCATLDRWVIDPTTAGGKTQISILMTAYTTNKTISIVGRGKVVTTPCNVWSDTETVDYFYIN